MITAEEFDKRFDNNEDIDEFIDYKNPIELEKFIKNLKDEVKIWKQH